MEKFFNLNTVQTILSAALVGLPLLLKATGCIDVATPDPNDADLDCSKSLLSPTLVWWALGIVTTLKFVIIPWLQPGGLVRNLFEPKVPVSTSGATGTVTPAQVQK